jgi:hypothetical protein
MAVILIRWSDGSILRRLIQLMFSLSRVRSSLATVSQGLEKSGKRAREVGRSDYIAGAGLCLGCDLILDYVRFTKGPRMC